MQATVPPVLFTDSAFHTYKGVKAAPKKFKCPHVGCDRSFAKSDHLRTHVRTHTGERPFRCTHEGCLKEFSDLANLKRHMRVHTGERPFTCPELGCGKQFSVSSNLKQHMRVHTGERPYSCPVCGKAFGHVSSRRKHMNIHEGTAFKVNTKTIVDKRTAVESFRRISSQSAMSVARWQRNVLIQGGPVHKRPSSRGSESSYESTSPVSFSGSPTTPSSASSVTTPDSATAKFEFSPSVDPLSAQSKPYQISKKENIPNNGATLVRPTEHRLTELQPAKRPSVREETSRFKAEDFHRYQTKASLPPVRSILRKKLDTEHPTPRSNPNQEAKEKVLTAAQISSVRYIGIKNTVDIGRYITIMMDTSYKMASLAIWLYQSRQPQPTPVPRKVAVRTVQ